MIHFRTHADHICYEPGAWVAGVRSKKAANYCPVPVLPGSWFNVTVVVLSSNTRASVYLDGTLVTANQHMSFPRTARGGMLFHRGFGDVIRFKNVEVKSVIDL